LASYGQKQQLINQLGN